MTCPLAPMRLLAACLALSLGLPAAAAAQGEARVTAELQPGWTTAEGRHIAALHLALAPGWKTYWHQPGEAGIPPGFDWSGSRNVAGVEIRWPHPRVFTDYGLETIGYQGEVLLPLLVTPDRAGDGMVLRGRAALGVCREVCLPVELEITASLPAAHDPSRHTGAIRAALAAAEKSTATGSGQAACRVDPIDDGLRLTARLEVAPQGGRERVFVEPADDAVWASPAEARREGDAITATADLVPPEARPFALDRSALAFTVLGRDGSVRLEGCAAG